MKNCRLPTIALILLSSFALNGCAQSQTGEKQPPKETHKIGEKAPQPEADEALGDWKTFTFEKHKFKAKFPEKPREYQEPPQKPTDDPTTSFEYLTGYLHLIVKVADSKIDYAARGITPEKALKSRRDNMLNAAKNSNPQIVNEYDFEQDGFPAKFLQIHFEDTKPVRCKFVQVGGKSYVAVAITGDEKAANAFLDSFEILK